MPLEGELVILREQRAEDMPAYKDWRNDLDTQAWTAILPPDYTLEMYQQRYAGREFSFRRSDGHFSVEWKATGELIGLISYTGLEPRWEATIGIVIDKAHWGTGAAFDAQETLLRFLFEHMGLRVVRLWTHTGNPGAVKLAEKSGFRQSARQPEGVFRYGQFFDNLSMDILREEYYERHPELADHLPPLG